MVFFRVGLVTEPTVRPKLRADMFQEKGRVPVRLVPVTLLRAVPEIELFADPLREPGFSVPVSLTGSAVFVLLPGVLLTPQ